MKINFANQIFRPIKRDEKTFKDCVKLVMNKLTITFYCHTLFLSFR